MKHKIYIGAASVITAVIMAGCYTQLMTPQQYLSAKRESLQVVHTVPSGPAGLNYSDNCLSCHSRYELEDRYGDLMQYGISTVHGYSLEPSVWRNSRRDVFIESDPFGWQNPVYSQPWWFPPPTATGAGTSADAAQETRDRTRTTGNTRDSNEPREREQPIPVYSPSSPVGGTSTPAPAVAPTGTSVATPPAQPASTPATESDSRKRSSSSDNTGRRNSGSTRDGDPR